MIEELRKSSKFFRKEMEKALKKEVEKLKKKEEGELLSEEERVTIVLALSFFLFFFSFLYLEIHPSGSSNGFATLEGFHRTWKSVAWKIKWVSKLMGLLDSFPKKIKWNRTLLSSKEFAKVRKNEAKEQGFSVITPLRNDWKKKESGFLV